VIHSIIVEGGHVTLAGVVNSNSSLNRRIADWRFGDWRFRDSRWV